MGHARVVDALVQAHASGTVHHAYLFAGPDGVGKRGVARAFAALVNCTGEAPTDAQGRRVDACGACRHCDRILRVPESHPDVLTLTLQGSRQIKIEQVREIIRLVPFPPLEAAYRVVVVDPADAMNEAAANALLKTLEEPSSRTRFVLVTSRPDALLTTIRSRCQRMLFGRLPVDGIARALAERHGVAADEAAALAALGDGSLGAALALRDDPVMAGRDALVRRFAAIPPGDVLDAFALASELADQKGSYGTILDILRRLYRDVLLLRTGGAARVGLALPHLQDVTEALAHRQGTSAVLHRLELIAQTERGLLVRNLNPRLAFERLLVALTAPPGEEGTAPGAPL